jgi:hypothetical protein
MTTRLVTKDGRPTKLEAGDTAVFDVEIGAVSFFRGRENLLFERQGIKENMQRLPGCRRTASGTDAYIHAPMWAALNGLTEAIVRDDSRVVSYQFFAAQKLAE